MIKKIGSKEQVVLNKALSIVRKFQIFKQYKQKSETFINHMLIHQLKQKLNVNDRSIPCAKMVGDQFRPECFIKGSGEIPLCAFECKKLTDAFAKARWKEGLSQALLYSHCYKATVLIFYDYTKNGAYSLAFGSKKSMESRFAESLRKAFRIYVVIIKPYK